MSHPLQQTQAAAIRVGLLTLLSLLLLGGSLLWLKGRTLVSGPTYHVFFRDVDGLKPGAAVQFMGIRAGYVDSIIPRLNQGRYGIEVVFKVTDAASIPPTGASLSIQQSGLIGDKFLEITPPYLQERLVVPTEAMYQTLEGFKNKDYLPLKQRYQEGLLTIGKVEHWEAIRSTDARESNRLHVAYRTNFRVLKPGATLPELPHFSWHPSTDPRDKAPAYLLIEDANPHHVLATAPRTKQPFTVENPMRLKEYLEVQLASAESLKTTNDKINQILDEKTIGDIQLTLDQVKSLTKQTTQLIGTTNQLFSSVGQDLKTIVMASQSLTTQLNTLSGELNDLVGDPQIQQDFRQTMHQLNLASTELNTLLQGQELKTTLASLGSVAQEVSGLSQDVRTTLQQTHLLERASGSLTQLESSLAKTDALLGTLQTATQGEEPVIREILQDSRRTVENLKLFSNRLKGRFVLWRLLF
jgi:phospholipid/cholesterol/gamma-HCH transport system substrate-binding protein